MQYVWPYDKFSIVNGHVIGGLVTKACSDSEVLNVYGTGSALRQFLYAKDFAKIIYFVAQNPAPMSRLILAPPSEHSIKQVAELIGNLSKKELRFDASKSDGQIKKYSKSLYMDSYIQGFQWTPLEIGLKETYDWYLNRCNDKVR